MTNLNKKFAEFKKRKKKSDLEKKFEKFKKTPKKPQRARLFSSNSHKKKKDTSEPKKIKKRKPHKSKTSVKISFLARLFGSKPHSQKNEPVDKKKTNKKLEKKAPVRKQPKTEIDGTKSPEKNRRGSTKKEKKPFFAGLFRKKHEKSQLKLEKQLEELKKKKPIEVKSDAMDSNTLDDKQKTEIDASAVKKQKNLKIDSEPKRDSVFMKLFRPKKDKVEKLGEKIQKEKEDLKKTQLKSVVRSREDIKKEQKKKEQQQVVKSDVSKKTENEQPKKKRLRDLFRKPADNEQVQESEIRQIFRKKAREKKKKISASARKRKLVDYLEKSGLEMDQQRLSKIIVYVAAALSSLISSVYLYFNLVNKASLLGLLLQILLAWMLAFVVFWGLTWVTVRIYLDLLMFNRKLSLEEVLPDFLQLTSANLRAGMPIDRSLWFAVRPRFGVLAHEIEDVAKRTLSGEDLRDALLDFAQKYDSQILLRSVYLLNEGMEAGGDVADLLNKIALNIQEMRGMKKEMAANVTTYVIFISFAAMIAAPFLFGLSSQLLYIVQSIATDVASSSSGQTSSSVGLSINISAETIKLSDYQIFAYISLAVSSFFSGVIVATIKKGNVKEGLHYIPFFMGVSIVVYTIANYILAKVFGSMF